MTFSKYSPLTRFQRDRRKYSKSKLTDALSTVHWQTDILDIQSIWNMFEHDLLTEVNHILPVLEFMNNCAKNVTTQQI